MAELLIGASAEADADPKLMREAGIGWVREGFPLPFPDRLYGDVTDRYLRAKARAQAWVAAGIEVMGVTPGPGHATYERDAGGEMDLVWHDSLPQWFGPLGSDQSFRHYRATCAWLARDLRGIVGAWQIANELDIRQFAGPLDLGQACDFILAGARGLKSEDPSLFVGPNSAGTGESFFLYGRLYADPSSPIDYCGVDQYYGTWQPGGPDLWGTRIADLYALTGRPVVINEWGYSSAGEVMTDEEARLGVPNCQLRKWRQTWGRGHTLEGQADFVGQAFEAFASQRAALAGVLFYRWEDQQRCWQCGSPECPVETRWGLVDLEGKPKPSFHAFQEGARRLVGG